jgi:hypothetical protein
MKTKDGTGIDNLDKKISYAAVDDLVNECDYAAVGDLVNECDYAAVGDLDNECDYAAVEGTKVAVKLINDEVLKGIIHIHTDFLTNKRIIEINERFLEEFQIKSIITSKI